MVFALTMDTRMPQLLRLKDAFVEQRAYGVPGLCLVQQDRMRLVLLKIVAASSNTLLAMHDRTFLHAKQFRRVSSRII